MSNENTYLQLDKQHNLKHLQDTRSSAAQRAVAKVCIHYWHPITTVVGEADDDELMLNVLRCHLTY